jgi:hypothetical protein
MTTDKNNLPLGQDPFASTKTVKVLATGDFQNLISNIFVSLKYVDCTHNYIQSIDVALNALTPFTDWSFPVISDTLGKVTYSGKVMLKNGTVRDIAETEVVDDSIIVPRPPVDNMKIEIVTDLLDFATVKLVRLTLRYKDEENLASQNKNFTFSVSSNANSYWEIPICNTEKKTFSWEAIYFLHDNTRKTAQGNDCADFTLILEVPV